MSKKKQILCLTGLILVLVLFDQLLKLYIAYNFRLGEAREVTRWFYICFVENDGIAFGISFIPKLLLTILRIVFVGVVIWYMSRLIRHHASTGYLLSVGALTAGAIGNIIDCLFYGLLFDYAPLCYGKVVDMLYFPLIHNSAGEVVFFQPVFNLADSYITVSVCIIVLFFTKDFNNSFSKEQNSSNNAIPQEPATENK